MLHLASHDELLQLSNQLTTRASQLEASLKEIDTSLLSLTNLKADFERDIGLVHNQQLQLDKEIESRKPTKKGENQKISPSGINSHEKFGNV